MVMKVIVGAIVFILFLVSPVYAQNCPPWMWGCQQYQDPYQQYQQTPQKHREHYTHRSVTHYPKHTVRHDDPKPVRHSHNDDSKSKPVYHVRVVPVTHSVKTWRDLSQDQGRDWIMEQAKAFCGRYPDDKACLKKQE